RGPRERLERGYFRRWLHQNGRDVAKLETAYTPAVARLLGVPRYLWRQAAIDALTAVRAALTLDDRRRFASVLRLIWFAGYVRETTDARLKPRGPLHRLPARAQREGARGLSPANVSTPEEGEAVAERSPA